jgi:hypothetical protein
VLVDLPPYKERLQLPPQEFPELKNAVDEEAAVTEGVITEDIIIA